MDRSTRRSRRLAIGGALGLAGVAAIGGAGLALVEGAGYAEGLALAFSTISTTGFGAGPQTVGGLVVTMLVFAAGAVCWMAILIAAVETALRRSGSSVGRRSYAPSPESAWPSEWLPPHRPRSQG